MSLIVGVLFFLDLCKAPERTTATKKVTGHEPCDHHLKPYRYFT